MKKSSNLPSKQAKSLTTELVAMAPLTEVQFLNRKERKFSENPSGTAKINNVHGRCAEFRNLKQ